MTLSDIIRRKSVSGHFEMSTFSERAMFSDHFDIKTKIVGAKLAKLRPCIGKYAQKALFEKIAFKDFLICP